MKAFALVLFILLSTACAENPLMPTVEAAAPVVVAVTPDPAAPVAPVAEAPVPTPAPAPSPTPAPSPAPAPKPAPVNCQVSDWVISYQSPWSVCKVWRQGGYNATEHFATRIWSRTVTVPPSGGGTACPVLSSIATFYEACTP